MSENINAETPTLTSDETTDDAARPRGRRSNKRHRDLTDNEKIQFGSSSAYYLFKDLNRGLNEIWEDFVCTRYYLDKVHESVRTGHMERVAIPKLVHDPRLDQAAANNIYGMLNRISNKSVPVHAFIDGVTKFEHFLSQLTLQVYRDFPTKLKGLAKDGENSSDSDARRAKLVDLILESQDREEMINRLIEEKVRGIFYGNPIDLFMKDRAKIGFGKYFKDNDYNALLIAFQEITARRNVIIHNQGRVDRKYMSEAGKGQYALGQMVDVNEAYIQTSFLVMKDLGAASAQRISTAVYKRPLAGLVRKIELAAQKRPAV